MNSTTVKSTTPANSTSFKKHITNHTAPTSLTITMQPWIKLSQEHQTAWDASLWDCMTTLTTILHQHHTEQLERVEEQISSLPTTIHNQYPREVSTTILDIATSHKQRHNHKTRSKPKRSTKPTRPSNKPPITQSTTTTNKSFTTPSEIHILHQGHKSFLTNHFRP